MDEKEARIKIIAIFFLNAILWNHYQTKLLIKWTFFVLGRTPMNIETV